ncbi:DMT family transporter [Sphingomonas naphthae]|uniref:DMT family transporter n=1 Tax=Sphingomonas naphthae TaxID=1813468 RepID=A0ABY7TSM9_9SPHN|nr:DMT family transporter [Sphingomonas naphthae]WCT75239.1 DMT family transporter [Sphingomonas naphthae]
MTKSSPRAAFLALTIAGVFWGLGFPLGKLALREIAPPHMVLLRFAVAALVALPFAIRTPAMRAMFRSGPVLAAGILYGIAFLVQFEGLARVSVTLAALLVGAMPALIAISARIMGERVTRLSWAGVAASTLGAGLIAGKPGGAGSVLGVILSLASLLIFLAWLIVLRRAPKGPSSLTIPAVTVIVAGLTVLPIAVAMHGLPPLALSAGAWAGIVGQGILSTFLATAAWAYGASRVDAASAGVFINIEPLMGAILGVALFGDRLTAALAIGGLLILIGSLAVVRGEKGEPTPPSPA